MIYLIDFENVHEDGFQIVGKLGDKDAVYCFFTKNVAKISMSALAGIRSGQLHFIEAESGKQSLDLTLVSYLGYLIGVKPQEMYYDIISNDNGFLKAADFWNRRIPGMRVRLRKTNAETKQKPQSQQAVYPQQVSAPAVVPVSQQAPTALSPSAPKTSQLAQPHSVSENLADPAITAALEAADMDPAAGEFLQQQVEKYRTDKNVKQLVYRAVVKKYGQRDGTKIYNSTKKLLLK